MPRNKHTPEAKAKALELLATIGLAEAARRTGIAKGTLASWGHREGVSTPDPRSMAPVLEAKLATVAQRKADLVVGLLDDIARLRSDLFAPTVERKAVVVSAGYNAGSTVEIVDVKHDTTSASERKLMVTAIAIAIDKVQVLTGEPTAIQGNIDQPAQVEARERALAVVTQMADRRVA